MAFSQSHSSVIISKFKLPWTKHNIGYCCAATAISGIVTGIHKRSVYSRWELPGFPDLNSTALNSAKGSLCWWMTCSPHTLELIIGFRLLHQPLIPSTLRDAPLLPLCLWQTLRPRMLTLTIVRLRAPTSFVSCSIIRSHIPESKKHTALRLVFWNV